MNNDAIERRDAYLDGLSSSGLREEIITIARQVEDITLLPEVGDIFLLASKEVMLAKDFTSVVTLRLVKVSNDTISGDTNE